MVVFRALELLAFGVFGVGGPTHEGGASGLETARTMCFWTSTRISQIVIFACHCNGGGVSFFVHGGRGGVTINQRKITLERSLNRRSKQARHHPTTRAYTRRVAGSLPKM